MRSVLVHGELAASDLASLFGAIGADQQAAAAYAFGPARIDLFVGRKFYLRSNDYLGLVMVAATDGVSERIDVSYAGAGSGFLGIQWGAGVDLENDLFGALQAVLRQ